MWLHSLGCLDLKVNGQPLAGREAHGYDEGGFWRSTPLHIPTPWAHRKLGMEQGAPSPGGSNENKCVKALSSCVGTYTEWAEAEGTHTWHPQSSTSQARACSSAWSCMVCQTLAYRDLMTCVFDPKHVASPPTHRLVSAWSVSWPRKFPGHLALPKGHNSRPCG